MVLIIDEEFISICNTIVKENKTLNEWVEIESSDMFQTNHYCGGFDATENEFCFSYYKNNKDYWFQVSLIDIERIRTKSITKINIRLADT